MPPGARVCVVEAKWKRRKRGLGILVPGTHVVEAKWKRRKRGLGILVPGTRVRLSAESHTPIQQKLGNRPKFHWQVQSNGKDPISDKEGKQKEKVISRRDFTAQEISLQKKKKGKRRKKI